MAQLRPELTYDRAPISTSGGTGRLFTPTRKKKLIAWLEGEG